MFVVRRKKSVALVSVSVLGAALAVGAVPFAAHADAGISGVDLSQYSLVGRYNLPEPTRTTPPMNSLLAQEASSVTYNWDDDSLYVVGDGGTSVVHVSKTGQLLDSMTLPPGGSPQGTEFYDTEGITYEGDGQFVMTEERDRQLVQFTYVPGGTLTRAAAQTVKLGTTIGNIGLEGVTYDPASTTSLPGFVVVKEKTPESIFQTNVDFANGTATNGSPTADEATNLFDPSLVGTVDFSDIYALSNQPSLASTPAYNNLIIDSQESGKLVEVDRSGNIQSSMDIVDAGAPLSVADETHEGVTMDRNGNIYMVSEDGGGDSNHPQLWVYSPVASGAAAAPRVAVTEVDSAGSSSVYGADWFELTNTGATDIDLSDWKMDDNSNAAGSAVPMTLDGGSQILPAGKSAVFLEDTDTGAGTTADPTRDAGIDSAFAQNWYGTSALPSGFLVGHYGGKGVGLSTGGDAVNIFDSTGSHVTGVSFGAPSGAATFDNTARQGAVAAPVAISEASAETVNKAFIAANGEIGSPDGIQSAGSVTPPPSGTVVISEVAPWGSGNAPYAADWFELTNTGTTDVNLTGWKMDDNSDSPANAVALNGVPTLPAGKSAIFMEDTAAGGDGSTADPTRDAAEEAAFAQAWFSLNALPNGFLVGHYGGGGVGLSTGGDHVNIFDGNGDRVTGVAFGASPSAAPFATFDNSAGAGSTTLPLPVITTMSAAGTNRAVLSADGQEIGSPGSFTGTTPPPPAVSVAITEVSPWASGNTPYAADWFELTNTGTSAVDLTGWKMDDNSDSPGNAVALNGVSSLPAGKSAIFMEDTGADGTSPDTSLDATEKAGFAQAWFGTGALPDGLLFGFYGGKGVGLSTGGDHVNVFDAAGNRVTGVAFGASPSAAPFATFDNTAGLGGATLPLPTISTLSAAGTNNAFLSADGQEIGSPDGFVALPSLVISEVAPWASGDSPYAADWFEVTNTGTKDVDLSGFKMDDNSNSFGSAVALSGVSSLPAGKSAIFMEDTGASGNSPDPSLDATEKAAFTQAWFGTSTLPDGLLFGFYGGKGVGLSTGGDAVNVFDAAGDRVTGVAFGASPSSAPFATFDNTVGVGSSSLPLPTIATLSVDGTNKAFLSADGGEIGSPDGAAAPDRTPPVITFSGNAGTYDVADTVAITCTATDAGSGLVSSTCANTDAPAWTFGPGSHTITATATDVAGNVATASVTFTVSASSDSLETVTLSFVAGAPNNVVTSTTGKVDSALKGTDKLPAGAKAAHLKNYATALAGLVSGGYMTADQAATLNNFAATL